MIQPRESMRSNGGAPKTEWPLTFALALLMLVGCSALGPLLRGSAWWWVMALVAVVVLVASAVLRRLHVARSLVPVAALGVLLATITLLFGGASALFWLFPTPETFGRFQSLIDSGVASITQQSTPAEATDGILFLLAGGAGLIAILIDILAITLRWPALAGLPLLIPVAVPGLLVEEGASAPSLILTAVAFLVLLRVDVRVRGRAEALRLPEGRDAPRIFAPVRRSGPGPLWGAIMVGSIGIVSALVLSTFTPALTEGGLAGTGQNGLLFSAGVNPMIDLGQDLRRPQDSPALHYTTTAEKQPYFKLLTLDQFVGTTWSARFDPINVDNTVDDIEKPRGLSTDVMSVETTTAVVIDGLETTWLPVPAPATSVAELNGDWYWGSRTLTVAGVNGSTTSGQEYTVTGLELAPTAEQLRDSTTSYPTTVAPNLDLPFPRPDSIEQTARDVTSGTTTPYDAAVALQDYLRGGEFTYDTEAPVEEGFDGGGVDVIGAFLEVKRGYCVQFASAMAIMARTLGIPARISLGYLPGTQSSDIEEGEGRYNVSSHDLHSWPELYFVGVGWVPFEPTPGRGTVPEYARPVDVSAPTNTPAASVPTSVPRDGEALTPDSGSVGTPTNQTQDAGGLLQWVIILAVLLFVLLTPGLVRGFRRALRRRRIVSGRGGAADAWKELTDTALDHGVKVRGTETPRELANHISMLEGVSGRSIVAGEDATAALWRLLVAEERQRYDRPGAGSASSQGVQLAHDLDRVIRAIHSGAEPRTRVLATALPASLWPTVLGSLHNARNDRTPTEA